MPTYDYSCRNCGYITTIICKIIERPETMPCLVGCGGEMRQDITAPAIQMDDMVGIPWLRDFAAHHNRQGGKRDRFGGKAIESRTDYNRYLKNHDLRPCGDGFNRSEV